MSKPSPSSANANANPPKPYNLSSLLSIPAPIATLFSSVPLHIYPSNPLPARSPSPSSLPILYIYGTPADCQAGNPSFHPGCLKWQTALRAAGIKHTLRPSTNHASPTGSLPFLLTPTNPPTTISTSGLQAYITSHSKPPPPAPSRLTPYLTLLTPIRTAYLHTLYLTPLFNSHTIPLYIPTHLPSALRYHLSLQLRTAAQTEICTATGGDILDIDDIYAEADRAWEALEELLGDDEWFFGAKEIGELDVGVFAWVWVVTQGGKDGKGDLGGVGKRVGRGLREHARRMYGVCWRGDGGE